MNTSSNATTAGTHAGEAYPHSYYAGARAAAPERPALRGSEQTEVCVIGAGFSGLATALELAERGRQVIVLEANRVGFGASGRNGGQIVNGYSRDIHVIARRYGEAAARDLAAMAYEGGDIIRARVKKYAIDCDLREGNVFAAFSRRQMRELQERASGLERYAEGNDFVWLDKNTIREHAATDLYVGGLLDRRGGHLHALNYALGEARAIESLGGVIHEGSPVTHVAHGPRPVVHTAAGSVQAERVVVCGNAYLGRAVPELEPRIMPASTQVITTEVLGAATCGRLMPAGTCIEDCNYFLDYYRMTADHRLLFGGGTVYGGTTPAHIEAKLRPHLKRTFPELASVRFEFAWSGNFALTLTRIPHLGKLDENIYFTHGYSGHGVTTTQLAGRLLAEAIGGDASRFEAFARLRNYPFPGGRTFRVPLTVLGSWYYLAREKLGL